MIYDVYIRYIPLPHAVEGVTLPNDDDTSDIYINSNICPELQEKALRHEIEHIKKDHLYDYNPVVINEKEADTISTWMPKVVCNL